jgi:Auxiliary Activity family 9 (formerly GH61)
MHTSTFTLLSLLLAAGSNFVSGHGIIKNVMINGKTYPGALGPGSDPANSPVRAVSSGDPIFDVNSPDMSCGTASQFAPISAIAVPGDVVSINWQAQTGIDWFHNVGE